MSTYPSVLIPVAGTLWVAFCHAATGQLRLTLLGTLGDVTMFVMYLGPIPKIMNALSYMNPAATPMLLTFTNWSSALAWLLYGLFIENWFVAAPQVGGTVRLMV